MKLTEKEREYIQAVRNRITPATWTQDCIARDKDKAEVAYDDLAAVCWCLEGHVRCVVPSADQDAIHYLLDQHGRGHKDLTATGDMIWDEDGDPVHVGDVFTVWFDGYIDFNDHWSTDVTDVIQLLDDLLAA